VDEILASAGIYVGTLLARLVLQPRSDPRLGALLDRRGARDRRSTERARARGAAGDRQMGAKALLYQLARGATQLGSGRFASAVVRAHARVEQWRSKPLSVLFISAVPGIPPFYLSSLVAGLLEIRFATFVVLGTVGRIIRFGAIAGIAVHAA
jgi:hypothetical protein